MFLPEILDHLTLLKSLLDLLGILVLQNLPWPDRRILTEVNALTLFPGFLLGRGHLIWKYNIIIVQVLVQLLLAIGVCNGILIDCLTTIGAGHTNKGARMALVLLIQLLFIKI